MVTGGFVGYLWDDLGKNTYLFEEGPAGDNTSSETDPTEAAEPRRTKR